MSGVDHRVGSEMAGIARSLATIAYELKRFNAREEARAKEGR